MKNRFFSVVVAIGLMFALASCNNPGVVIQANVTAANRACPTSLGNGLTLASVNYEGSYVVYNFKGEGLVFSQSNVTDEMKSQVVSELQKKALFDEPTSKFLKALKEAGVGIIYHYYGDSESIMDVIIESREL